MDMNINEINDSILDSYRELGGINHLSGTTLPSREDVETILNCLESLIFPGFQAEELLDSEYIAFNLGSKVNRLAGLLTVEIAKSLRYKCLLEHKVCHRDCRERASKISLEILSQIPELRKSALKDVQSALSGDPAAKSVEEIILSYPGVEAITAYRIAHLIYHKEVPLIPRMISEHMHRKTGIDIHPGAEIGDNFFIDHGTGVVIGETSVIGKNVKIYQGVTLGALSVKKEDADIKRHPTIEDNVTIYAGATILGGDTIIGTNSVIGGNVWITSSIEPGTLVYDKTSRYGMKQRK